jgi:hypothetical protein
MTVSCIKGNLFRIAKSHVVFLEECEDCGGKGCEHTPEAITRLRVIDEKLAVQQDYPKAETVWLAGEIVAKCILALREAAAFIRDMDGGDQASETGWRSDEYLEQWLKIVTAIREIEKRRQ